MSRAITPVLGADMASLDYQHAAGHGHTKVLGNGMVRGENGVGYDLGVLLSEFRSALKEGEARSHAVPQERRFHDLALATGRPGLGGFAPVAGVAGRNVGAKNKATTPAGEGGAVLRHLSEQEVPGHLGARADTAGVVLRPGAGEVPSYSLVVAQARQQAEVVRQRRQAERVGGRLLVQGAALAGVSFAPPARGGVADGVSLYPAKPAGAAVSGLRRRGSVAGAAAMAEAASQELGEAGGQQFTAMVDTEPVGVTPFDMRRALEMYFFPQSRLPPAGAAGFNPLLSPVWAGLKIPG